MKNYLFTFFIFLFSTVIYAQELQVYFYKSSFYSPQNGPYLETYISVIGSSTMFKQNEQNKFQSTLEVTQIFKQDTVIKKFSKYVLTSPELDDTLQEKPNFIDQQRFQLPNGIYNYELIIYDIHNPSKKFKYNDIVTLMYDSTTLTFSGSQLIEKYKKTTEQNILSKSGYDLVPYISNFYPQNISQLTFYTELYNLDKTLSKGEPFLVKYYIEYSEKNKIIQRYNQFQKQKTNHVNILFNNFDISKLPSGNYNLVMEVINQKNDLIKTKKIFFQRSNTEAKLSVDDITLLNIEGTFASRIKSMDTISMYLDYIAVIAELADRNLINKLILKRDQKLMQQYFFNFWTNKNSDTPELEWRKYLQRINYVNYFYGSLIRKGYETDRGRIYLQYGVPNTIDKQEHDPTAYPYEIWHYYYLTGLNGIQQGNCKFVFYNPYLTGEDFTLIHSTTKGEIKNPDWKTRFIMERDGTIEEYNEMNRYFNNP